MDILIQPRLLQGKIQAIPSKSQAHRLLICAAFADGKTSLLCGQTSKDIAATAACLEALGAKILRNDEGYHIAPIAKIPEKAVLPCGESGSTLRFLLPIVGALGVDGIFEMEGRLSQRPLSPLWEEMERMGCKLQWIDNNHLRCSGQLQSGAYHIDGGVSSQFITGLLFATSLLSSASQINILGNLESKEYVTMTQQAMGLFGVKTDGFHVAGKQVYHTPGQIVVEGDWSNGAFWLAAKALGSAVEIYGLDEGSSQGDRAALPTLQQLKAGYQQISAVDIPDLVPILAVAASAFHGAEFTGIRRLRLKESDRVASVMAMLEQLGGKAEATEDTLTIYHGGLCGGVVDACNDHRIAMAAAIAATVCTESVTILGAEAVNKSYPGFWDAYTDLGGHYEKLIR